MGVERAHQPLHTLTVAGNGELQLFQMFGVHEPAYEQRVTGHVAHQAAEVLPLRRLSGAEQLRQGVLVGELVPMSVVFDPEGAHEAAGLGREDDDAKQRRAVSGERYPHFISHRERQEGEHRLHRFCLAYVPISCVVPSTWPCIAASTSFFWAPALRLSRASRAYSLKK